MSLASCDEDLSRGVHPTILEVSSSHFVGDDIDPSRPPGSAWVLHTAMPYVQTCGLGFRVRV